LSDQRALLRAARAFEASVVVPHCAACRRPCCGLDDVVLALSFGQVQRLYAIEKPRKDFDRALPSTLKKQGDRYYAHGAPCPAYDLSTRQCRVYGTPDKPQECSDFPIYEDGGVVTVDVRCEAVRERLADLRQALRDVAGDDLVEAADDEFPDTFVAFHVASPKVKAKKRSIR
jgi:Fe-S-cluster containining protein